MAIKIIILGIIIYIKGIFSSAETAYTYLNKAKFNQMSKRKNKIKERKINKKEKISNLNFFIQFYLYILVFLSS